MLCTSKMIPQLIHYLSNTPYASPMFTTREDAACWARVGCVSSAEVLLPGRLEFKPHYLVLTKDEFWVVRVCEILTFSSCALPELGRARATKVNKLTNVEYASLFSSAFHIFCMPTNFKGSWSLFKSLVSLVKLYYQLCKMNRNLWTGPGSGCCQGSGPATVS